jgi:hypothetical protein
MAISSNGMPTKTQITAVINKIIQRQDKPITLEGIQKELSGSYQVKPEMLAEILAGQVRINAVYQWPDLRNKKRFWIYELELYAQQLVLEILSKQALTHTELQNVLKRQLFGCPLKRAIELRKKILIRLLRQKRLFMHPPMGRQRLARFGVALPALGLYFKKVKEEFNTVCQKLAKAGIPLHEILLTVKEVFNLTPSGLSVDIVSNIDSTDTVATISGPVCKAILEKIVEIEPAAKQQVLVSIPVLRTALNFSKIIFDRAILQLAEQEKIFLHRHVYPFQMTDAERLNMVADEHGNYYMGVVLRN